MNHNRGRKKGNFISLFPCTANCGRSRPPPFGEVFPWWPKREVCFRALVPNLFPWRPLAVSTRPADRLPQSHKPKLFLELKEWTQSDCPLANWRYFWVQPILPASHNCPLVLQRSGTKYKLLLLSLCLPLPCTKMTLLWPKKAIFFSVLCRR